MNAKQVCAELGISSATLNRWQRRGVLKPIPTKNTVTTRGQERRFKVSDVAKLKRSEE